MNIYISLSKLKLIITKKIKTLNDFISTFLAELLLVLSAFFMCYATYKINIIAFYYVLAVILGITGWFIAKTRR